LRGYVKKISRETWDYVNWLTHAKNAGNYDAEIGIAAVSHLLATVTAASLRRSQRGHRRCETCGSYSAAAGAMPAVRMGRLGLRAATGRGTERRRARIQARRALHAQLRYLDLHDT
jgi:ribosomal protein S14